MMKTIMTTPPTPRLRRGTSGQMLVIALLIASVMGIIGASVATQVVNEQRRIRIEERTQRAFTAAESGLERAIEELSNNPAAYASATPFTIDGVSVVLTRRNIDTTGGYFLYPLKFNSGDSAFFSFISDGPSPSYYNQQSKLCVSSNNTAVVGHVFHKVGTTTQMNTFVAQRGTVFDGAGVTAGETSVSAIANCPSGTTWSTPLPTQGQNSDFMVFWVYKKNTTEETSVAVHGNGTLPAQGKIVTATASVKGDNGNTTVRRVRRYLSNRRYPPSNLFFLISAQQIVFGPARNW